MDRTAARSVLDALLAAQNAMYAGGDIEPVRRLLTADVEWHVPGCNAIAGRYGGWTRSPATSAAAETSPPARCACTLASCSWGTVNTSLR